VRLLLRSVLLLIFFAHHEGLSAQALNPFLQGFCA
jgi:hypothetical protein